MVDVIGIMMLAGKSAVNIALYTLIPIMVVMLVVMNYLEEKGIIGWIIGKITPVLAPFGITGMAAFAAILMSFVSFAAPLATLTLMEKKGTSDRCMATTLAMLMAMGQGNVILALVPLGLHWGVAMIASFIGGIVASSFTWYLGGRQLSNQLVHDQDAEKLSLPYDDVRPKSVITIVSDAGRDAIKMSFAAIPMLTISLVIVGILQAAGVINIIEWAVSPLLHCLSLSDNYVLLALTKCLAGGMAYFSAVSEMVQSGKISVTQLNASAGLLIHTFDLAGVGIFLAMSHRFARLMRYAVPGILVGIAARSLIHFCIFG